MSATISTIIPNRNELLVSHEQQAQLYLRKFDPKVYSGFYARIYDAEAYLEQVGIEKICELVEHGNNILGIAQKLDISSRTLRRWVNSNEYRRSLVKEAQVFAGDAFAYKAEKALKDSRGGSKEDVALAGKLAEHYRWMATKLDKEIYGEAKKDDKKEAPQMNVHLNFGGEVKAEEITVNSQPLIASFMNLSEGE